MRINPDKDIVNEIRQSLKITGGFCPCKVGKLQENKCPCIDMKEKNICICGLYI